MTEIKLSDTQTTILTTACAREGGAVLPVAGKLKGGAVTTVCNSLLKRGLVEEVAAADGDTVWRQDDDIGPLTLRASVLAYEMLGLSRAKRDAPTQTKLRKGTKQEMLLTMLRAPEGASIDEMVAATNWLPHTARATLTNVVRKKLGLILESEKVEGRGRVYRARDSHPKTT